MIINTTIIIITSIVNLFIAALIYLRSKKRIVNIYFSLFVICIVGWSVNILITQLTSSIFIGKMTFLFASFIPAWFILFVKVFPYEYTKVRKKVINFLIVCPSIIFSLFVVFTDYIFKGIEIVGSSINTHTGSLYPFFSFYFLSYIIFGFYSLIRKYKKSSGVIKAQIAYLFLGTFLFSVFGTLTNLILPLFGIYYLNTIGPSFSVIMIAFTAYSITKHRLLDIRLVILRTITYSLVVLLISATVVVLTLLLPQILEISLTNRILISIAVSIFIVLILDPLKKSVAKASDFLFYKARINYQKLLGRLTDIINREIDVDVLVEEFTKLLKKELKI